MDVGVENLLDCGDSAWRGCGADVGVGGCADVGVERVLGCECGCGRGAWEFVWRWCKCGCGSGRGARECVSAGVDVGVERGSV